ncbi:MAG: tryptophan transporter [Tissierellia bacterium]|nr:tryptophan transporter [Tissierellia bacterium]
MKLRNNILTALLLATGLILHQITPGILGGMKFDFLLSFVFISLIINPTFENTLLTGLLGGLLAAMTTAFPGGQIPNVIDKLVACFVLFPIIRLIPRERFNLMVTVLIGGLGTLVSGTAFLASALFIVGLPAPMSSLMVTVVLPTVVVNAVGTALLYTVVKRVIRVSGFSLD